MALISKLTAIADAIRSKTNTSEKLTLDEMPSAIEGIQSGGGVDIICYATDWAQLFQNSVFEENTEVDVNSKVNINSTTSNMFAGAKNVKKIKLSATFSQYPITVNYMFSNCLTVEEIDISNLNFQIYNSVSAFQGCSSLKKIIGIIDFSKALNITNFFYGTIALEEVRIKENSLSLNVSLVQSPNLSDASIDSLVKGFADMTGQTSIVFTVHKDVKAKIEANQTWLSTLTSKNVTLA